ncbi:MAG TPA: TatD family hydrolase [Gemmatimonadales bacterium]
MLVDTHCHLTDPAFEPDRDAAVERMRAAGVSRALVIESQLPALANTLAWVVRHPGLALGTGCHPHDAKLWDAVSRSHLEAAWANPVVRAVGEIGLDYHYDHSPRDVQQDAFAQQLALADALGMPVVIHAREADADVVAILRTHPSAKVILHSFSSGTVLRDAGLDAGWYFSFSGMITFKSWTQLDTVRAIPIDRLLIETDAPYLAPVPRRGTRNEPAFITHTAERLAEIRGTTLDEIAAVTTTNALRLIWDVR